jgi:hypothetical protein
MWLVVASGSSVGCPEDLPFFGDDPQVEIGAWRQHPDAGMGPTDPDVVQLVAVEQRARPEVSIIAKIVESHPSRDANLRLAQQFAESWSERWGEGVISSRTARRGVSPGAPRLMPSLAGLWFPRGSA